MSSGWEMRVRSRKLFGTIVLLLLLAVYATIAAVIGPGRIALAPEKFATLFDPSTGPLDPEDYYFRTAPTFETGSEKYAWINAIQAVGIGQITEGGVSYEIHEIK